jgi:hypothetical protein
VALTSNENNELSVAPFILRSVYGSIATLHYMAYGVNARNRPHSTEKNIIIGREKIITKVSKSKKIKISKCFKEFVRILFFT